MSTYTALSTEITRLTTSPYPSQLRTLLSAASSATDAEIAQWASAKPCQVEPLASCLIEGLQQWGYVLEIVTKFAAGSRACRDAFLRAEPTLLHSVVANAVKNGPEKSKYTRASVALLSRELPDTVALPAEAQTLFVQLVESAARNPSAKTIEPVYIILTGTGNLLLGILSTEVLARFEENLVSILRHASSGAADQTLSLYCLSIMNVVLSGMDPEFRLTGSSYNTQDFLASTPQSTRWKSEAMQQFFEGNKAQRSTQLIALLVLSALSTSERSSSHIKSIVLANEVILAIPVDLRKIWCAANTTTIRRIQEKLCTQDLDARLKTLGLRFMGKLCEFDSLPHPVLENLETTFLNPTSMQIVHTLCPHVNDCDLFSSVLARAPISHLLQNAVDYAIRSDTSDLAAGLDAITRMMRDAASIIEDHKITVHQVREILADETFLRKLQVLHEKLCMRGGEQQRGEGWCKTALHRKRSELAHQITNLLLRASQKSAIGPQSMTLLLELHAESARGEVECDHGRSSWREHLNFGQANGLDESSHDEVDWREALQTHFRARAEVEQDAVTSLFTKACANLEARCENVEKPLREARERCRALEEHNEALKSAFAEMEGKYVEAGAEMRGLEEERDQYIHDLEESRDANAELMERVAGLEEKLRQTQEDARRELRAAREEREMAELEHQAAIAQKEERFDELQERYEEIAAALTSQRRVTADLEDELRSSREEHKALEGLLQLHQSKTRDLENALSDLERTNDDLSAAKSRLEEELRSANSSSKERVEELNTLRYELKTLGFGHEELKRMYENSTSGLEELRQSLRESESHIDELEISHRRALTELQGQLEEAHRSHENVTAELQAKEMKVKETEKRVERYKKKCELKDQQIQEAEAMRTNLMAAMGIQQAAKLPYRTQETQDVDDSTMMDVEESQAEQRVEQTQQNQQAEPEPKRPRSGLRKSAPNEGALRASFRTSKVGTNGRQSLQVGMGRTALRDLSANQGGDGRKSLGVGFKTPGRGSPTKTTRAVINEEGVGEDESTFEGSELFAGTQGGQVDLGLGGLDG